MHFSFFQSAKHSRPVISPLGPETLSLLQERTPPGRGHFFPNEPAPKDLQSALLLYLAAMSSAISVVIAGELGSPIAATAFALVQPL